MVRCGDTEQALGMVRSMYKSAMDARQKYTEEMKDPDLDDSDRRRLRARLDRAAEALEKSGDLRRTLIEQLMERDLPRVRQILAEARGASASEIEASLASAGVAPEVVVRLKSRGGLLENLGKKRHKIF